MAKIEQFQLSKQERQHRRFSDSFKQQKVKEIELGYVSPTEISKQYQVTRANVYRWMLKFGSMKGKQERIILESTSDTKQLLLLKQKVADLERIIGQKQLLIDFKDKMIDLAEETYGVEIKKNFSTRPSQESGKTKGKTGSV
jgi:transposase-like protein